jgi:molecular chaperone GrpE
LAAEFENYKKRMMRDKQTALKYAEEYILKDLLPALDNLERAINQDDATKDVKTLIEGVELTLKGLQSTLSKYGLEPIESVGKPFDPNLHEALVMEASDEVPAQSVLREFEKGYHYKDRLLRAAKVVVSKGQD